MDIDPALGDTVLDPHQPDTEAALAALRDALHHSTTVPVEELSTQAQNLFPPDTQDDSSTTAGQSSIPPSTSAPAQTSSETLAKGLSALNSLMELNQTMITGMNIPGMLVTLASNYKLLIENQKKTAEVVKALTAHMNGNPSGSQTLAALDLSPAFVSREEHESLKTKYEQLRNSTSIQDGAVRYSRRKTIRRISPPRDESPTVAPPPIEWTPEEKQRKKRSIKLEHLVHKLANQRLGVEYNVSGFEVKGSKDLPDIDSDPPSVQESVNKVVEYRPDFEGDSMAPSVKPFLDAVEGDVIRIWEEHYASSEPDVNREKLNEAVNNYWSRLMKRWKEQEARDRGELNRDQLARKRQNQYRRQQSLLARRVAAFDQSPLNTVRLRSLYRTLLTIDFTHRTEDRPDSSRAYSEEEWKAYQKMSGDSAAHEVVDIWWMSPLCRNILSILDASATDQSSRIKRKGKPKAPAKTFHLPQSLWDKSTDLLPDIIPKDNWGLPWPGEPGIVIFKFQANPAVQAINPKWYSMLYDDPPIPSTDTELPSLSETLNGGDYSHLRGLISAAKLARDVKVLSGEEVKEVLEKPEGFYARGRVGSEIGNVSQVGRSTVRGPLQIVEGEDDDDSAIGTPDILSRNLETYVSQNIRGSQPRTHPQSQLPNPGSSISARKMNKELLSQPPEGAAMPLMNAAAARKRKRYDLITVRTPGDDIPEIADDGSLRADMDGDQAFLDSL